MPARKRIAIVGAGHNALVCTCYLAKAGHDITVFERRSGVGGAVNTEKMWDGYQVDTHSKLPGYLISLCLRVPESVVIGVEPQRHSIDAHPRRTIVRCGVQPGQQMRECASR